MEKLNHFDVIGILLVLAWIIGYLLLGIGGGVHTLLVMTLLFLVMGNSIRHPHHKV